MKSNLKWSSQRWMAAYLMLLSFAYPALGQEGFTPFVAVDMTGGFKVDEASTADDRFEIREAEFSLAAPVDHIFDGMFSIAAHSEEGEHVFELHEAWLSTTKLVARMQLKAGQFFLGIGRLNRVHRHDWPFISAPVVHKRFFGDEGALDSGGEVSSLLPLPFFLELSAGVTNGFIYGHSHNAGEKPRQPTHYARLATASEALSSETLVALNYLSRTDAAGERTQLFGTDFVAKWQRSLLQAELWQRQVEPAAAKKALEQGAYLFTGFDLTGAVGAGLRLEHFSMLTLKDALGYKVENSIVSMSPQLSYRASEFSLFRSGVTFQDQTQESSARKINRTFEIQLVYIMGAHPAHDF